MDRSFNEGGVKHVVEIQSHWRNMRRKIRGAQRAQFFKEYEKVKRRGEQTRRSSECLTRKATGIGGPQVDKLRSGLRELDLNEEVMPSMYAIDLI